MAKAKINLNDSGIGRRGFNDRAIESRIRKEIGIIEKQLFALETIQERTAKQEEKYQKLLALKSKKIGKIAITAMDPTEFRANFLKQLIKSEENKTNETVKIIRKTWISKGSEQARQGLRNILTPIFGEFIGQLDNTIDMFKSLVSVKRGFGKLFQEFKYRKELKTLDKIQELEEIAKKLNISLGNVQLRIQTITDKFLPGEERENELRNLLDTLTKSFETQKKVLNESENLEKEVLKEKKRIRRSSKKANSKGSLSDLNIFGYQGDSTSSLKYEAQEDFQDSFLESMTLFKDDLKKSIKSNTDRLIRVIKGTDVRITGGRGGLGGIGGKGGRGGPAGPLEVGDGSSSNWLKNIGQLIDTGSDVVQTYFLARYLKGKVPTGILKKLPSLGKISGLNLLKGTGAGLAGLGLEYAGDKVTESGHRATGGFMKLAGSTISGASLGGVFGGPVGAVAGGILGLGWELIKQRKEFEQRQRQGFTGNLSSAEKTALEEISRTEGTSGVGGYDVTLGYGKFLSPETKRFIESQGGLSKMKMKDIRTVQEEILRNSGGLNSSALGKYQFVGSTLFGRQGGKYGQGGLYKKFGLSEDTVFTPELQDRLAAYLLKENLARGGNVGSVWEGVQKKGYSPELAASLRELKDSNDYLANTNIDKFKETQYDEAPAEAGETIASSVKTGIQEGMQGLIEKGLVVTINNQQNPQPNQLVLIGSGV